NRDFYPPERIVEISGDADTLIAFSDEGRLYQCYFEKSTSNEPFTWLDRFGWPERLPLIQNELVLGNRGWAVGTRRKDVLWYEDPAGNQHHYGTMGIETTYFLSADGQEIRYIDSGLPADFSHGILGPERGRFIAASLSASGSTVFLINNAGEMYTRLADFDTLGNDPMFFKYTYDKEVQKFKGSDYRSNFTPWALPAEDWYKQPPIPITDKARITTNITILQTGKGNFARELRVAGLSPEGKTGYYFKAIRDDSWSFKACPLFIDPLKFVDHDDPSAGLRGNSREISYTSGSLWIGDNRNDTLTFSIPDFSMIEGSCHLDIGYGKETFRITLHPVDVWTYLRRYNPGMDGTPKYFFITIDAPPESYRAVSKEFHSIVVPFLSEKHLSLFSCRAEATDSYILIEGSTQDSKPFALFLTVEGFPSDSINLVRTKKSIHEKQIEKYFDDSLVLHDTDHISITQRKEVEAALTENLRFRNELQAEIDAYQSYRRVAGLSRFGYGAFDFVTKVTLLNRIDFPKFKTVTSYGKEIMTTNAAAYSFMAESREWIYSKMIELLDLRIREYQKVIDAFDDHREVASVNPHLRDTFIEYFDSVSFPETIRGTLYDNDGKEYTAEVLMLLNAPLFPGLEMETHNGRYLIELKDMARLILDREGDDVKGHPFRADILIYSISGTSA
ncbi:MAG TPA: hypothetical protein PLG43_11955, partial [Spirochaetia bacterium]|nr:hypothetical protein [Spirochaetia bacterium]